MSSRRRNPEGPLSRVEEPFYKFQGELDEVALYDYALSEAQIRAHYTASGR